MKSGDGAPLFIIHGMAGAVTELLKLGELIRSSRPVYAVQARGLYGEAEPLDSIPQMAKSYAASMKVLQPRGPYFLAGYSFGGVVAFEMAQQLRSAGEEVALLILLDAYTHPQSWPTSCRVGVLWARIRYRAALALRVPVGETIRYYRQRFRGLKPSDLREQHRGDGRHLGAGKTRRSAAESVVDASYLAWGRYRPSFYPGRITFLKAEGNWGYPQDPRKIWLHLAADFDLRVVPGEHTELVGRAVEHLAQAVSSCLREVRRPGIVDEVAK
jgi:acetoacetyl-CoA synthetase